MPIRPGKVPMIVDGKLKEIDRYSEIESIFVNQYAEMEAFIDGFPSSLLKLCQEKRVPCVPVYDISEVMIHPQIKGTDFFVELKHTEAGKLKYPKGPCTFEKTDWEWHQAAPRLGEHNEQVFCDRMGYSRKELAAMQKSGVV